MKAEAKAKVLLVFPKEMTKGMTKYGARASNAGNNRVKTSSL
jgi:hypothetical protein